VIECYVLNIVLFGPKFQFRPAGQAILGANNVISRQMSHFPQPGQHLPHSGQALHASQAAPMAYQPARTESSAPLLSQQSVFPGGYLPTTGAPMPPPSYTVSLIIVSATVVCMFVVSLNLFLHGC
jgi:hypothetical protein